MRTSNLIVAKLCDTAAGRWHSIIRGNQIMQQTEPLFALSLSLSLALPRSLSNLIRLLYSLQYVHIIRHVIN